jgi:hypothetical protein
MYNSARGTDLENPDFILSGMLDPFMQHMPQQMHMQTKRQKTAIAHHSPTVHQHMKVKTKSTLEKSPPPEAKEEVALPNAELN